MKQSSKTILALFLAALATLVASTPAAAAGDIVVAAPEATAVVPPRSVHLKLVNLPALKFGLRAAFKCKGDPVSVTLSIADTHATLGREQLADQRAAEATLTVPPQQLALTAISGFCIADDADTDNELLVPGLATAHASLRCSSEDGESVHYASAPLQVRLICERGTVDDQAPSEAR
jgi:hypothetical protein